MVSNIAKMKVLLGDHVFEKIENKMNKNQVGKMQDSKENIKLKTTHNSKEKDHRGIEKDLSKSHLSTKETKMAKTMNLSSRNFDDE